MKAMLAIVAILALASATVGGTFAGFSDTEESEGNYIITGSLDLKVAKIDGNAGGIDFRDDEPYGVGLERCFFVPVVNMGETYTCKLMLWNAGTEDAIADIHLKIVKDPQNSAENTFVTIWFDTNNSGFEDAGDFIMFGILAQLACTQIDLGLLPKEAVQRLSLKVTPNWGTSAENELIFDTLFSLVDKQQAFSDTEESRSFFDPNPGEMGGTPGFWRSPAALNQYGVAQLAGWFREIVQSSAWFEDNLASGSDAEVYAKMVDILASVGGAGDEGMFNHFRSQYLATRLNAVAGRLGLNTSHDISSIPGAVGYFGGSQLTLSQIINVIEARASPPPDRPQLEIMKDVCDALNNLDI